MISVGPEKRPFLDYLLLHAHLAGYRDVVIVVGEHDASIPDYYAGRAPRKDFPGMSITFAEQGIPPGRTKPLGTADALLQGLRSRPGWKGKHLTVCNSDNLYSVRALALMREAPSGCAMVEYDREALGFSPARIEQFALVVKDDRRRLLDILEKPSLEEVARLKRSPGKIGVSMNLWRFPYDRILPCLEETPLHPLRHERELPGTVRLLLRRWPGSLEVLSLSEGVPDLTSPSDIVAVRRYLSGHHPQFGEGDHVREEGI
jgi:glucose-1-phosphate adenylyltransferase